MTDALGSVLINNKNKCIALGFCAIYIVKLTTIFATIFGSFYAFTKPDLFLCPQYLSALIVSFQPLSTGKMILNLSQPGERNLALKSLFKIIC